MLITTQVHSREFRGHNTEENNYGAEGSEIRGFTESHTAGHISTVLVLGHEPSVVDTLTPSHDTLRDSSLEGEYRPTLNGPRFAVF